MDLVSPAVMLVDVLADKTAPPPGAVGLQPSWRDQINGSKRNLLQEPWVVSPAWEGWAEPAE